MIVRGGMGGPKVSVIVRAVTYLHDIESVEFRNWRSVTLRINTSYSREESSLE
jgi:hypothetical protein